MKRFQTDDRDRLTNQELHRVIQSYRRDGYQDAVDYLINEAGITGAYAVRALLRYGFHVPSNVNLHTCFFGADS